MILTGIAKKDFLSYYGTGEGYFSITISKIEQNANIIEWLDSVGIYISVTPIFPIEYYVWSYTVNSVNSSALGAMFNPSRHQATEEAIKQANIIYNNKKGHE